MFSFGLTLPNSTILINLGYERLEAIIPMPVLTTTRSNSNFFFLYTRSSVARAAHGIPKLVSAMAIDIQTAKSVDNSGHELATPKTTPKSYPNLRGQGLTGLAMGSRDPFQLSTFDLPLIHRAVITPTVGKSLNLSVREIPVRLPSVNESVVKISYSGICYSVSPDPFSFQPMKVLS